MLVIQALPVVQVTNAVVSGEADIGFTFNLPLDPKLRVAVSAGL